MNGPIKDLMMSLSNFFITKADAYLVSLNVLTHTKITLSPDELQLVNNADWILTKRVIIDKTVQIFSDLSGKMRNIIEKEAAGLPQAVLLSEPKISRGENYRLLPYVMLDYPRCFDATNSFAVRTMFWWGNFFSITLQLSGEHTRIFEEDPDKKIAILQQKDHYICINEDQWQHHFEEDNYALASSKTVEEIHTVFQQQPFIKIARKFSLAQWNEMPAILERSFSEMILLVKT